MKYFPYSYSSKYEERGGSITIEKKLPGGNNRFIDFFITLDGKKGMKQLKAKARREIIDLNLRHWFAFGWWRQYFATLDRNGTEDEITICTPEGRPMLCVAFWDKDAWDEGDENADRLKADVVLIVRALNLRHWLTAPARWIWRRTA